LYPRLEWSHHDPTVVLPWKKGTRGGPDKPRLLMEFVRSCVGARSHQGSRDAQAVTCQIVCVILTSLMSDNHASNDFSSGRRGLSQVLALKSILAGILLLGCFLRFYHLDGYGLWSDEFVTLMIVSKSSCLELIRTCFKIPQPMPPLYFILNRLFIDLLGTSEISLRLLSAISSTLVVYFVFAIGRILFNCEVGIFAALLCAVNSTQIVYAQNARPYALCLLLSTISLLNFLRWVKAESRVNRLSFIVVTTLLLYAHYIFFLVLLIQNLYFLWLYRSQTRSASGATPTRSWKSWLLLQLSVGVLIIPLAPQLWSVFRSRQSLNWAGGLVQYFPRYEAFFFFLNPSVLFFSLVLTLVISGAGLYLRGLLKPSGETSIPSASSSQCASPGSLIFLMLWYLAPLGLFFTLARMNLIHLFVERYLILASLASYLLLAAVPLCLLPRAAGRTFLMAYVLVYVVADPGNYFLQKGQFSQGVPGGNEWRETLTRLAEPGFDTPLFLFQSPFIESNQLDFASDDGLVDYLAAPLRSFYVRDRRPFELLPVHWWIDSERHLQFKMKIKKLVISNQEFTLLSTEEFWTYFKPWLDRELAHSYQMYPVASFKSSGALHLRRIKLSAR